MPVLECLNLINGTFGTASLYKRGIPLADTIHASMCDKEGNLLEKLKLWDEGFDDEISWQGAKTGNVYFKDFYSHRSLRKPELRGYNRSLLTRSASY